jgi:6-phosphogluconolactonase
MRGGERKGGGILNQYTFDNPKAMFNALAEFFAETARNALEKRGNFAVAVSGGGTPATLFDLLAAESAANAASAFFWESALVFQVDERAVPPEHEWSNFRMLNERLLSKVPVRPENIRRIKGEHHPERAAEEYERVLRGFRAERPKEEPLFDLVLLGIGEDGHTASIFPGSAAELETARLAVPVPPPTTAAPRIPRVTMTFPALNDAETAAFIVTGKKKADIVRGFGDGNAAEGAGKLPPEKIEALGDVKWFVSVREPEDG